MAELELEAPRADVARCSKCRRVKPHVEFRSCNSRKNRHRRVRFWCRECEKKHYIDNPLLYRSYNLKNHYGIDLVEYDRMLARQGGGCAICGRKPEGMWRGNPKPLMVDHDHATGAVRGLLCGPCNAYLGYRRDDTQAIVDHAKATVRYLITAGASPPIEPVAELSVQGLLDL